MNKADIIEFFNSCAPSWDAEMIKDDRIINCILDKAGIVEGTRVLDVACGTGVLFPYYAERGAHVTGIDISPEMVIRARKKFPNTRVICGDVESFSFDTAFDSVVVYNAFPHFPEPERLIRALALLLTPGGRLTVAHGMSQSRINTHHSGAAAKVSIGLLGADELAEIMNKQLRVDVKISDDEKYILSAYSD